MKQSLKITLLGLGMMTLMNCQQVNPVTTGPFTPDEPAGNGLTLCPDGTLNCYVEFPDNNTTFDQFDFSQSYTACMDACLPASCTDGGGDIIDEAADECPQQFATCDAECSLTSDQSPIAGLPDSDGLTLPENPKAILVEVTGCFSNLINEIHFKGPEINVVTPIEGKRSVIKSGGFFGMGGSRKVHLGYGVGRNPACPAGYKNKIKVVAKPNTSNSVSIGSNTITVVPFANAETVEKMRSIPHSLSFSAISTAMKEELDLGSVVVIPKSFGEPNPSALFSFNDWRYYNNSDIGYGTTVLFLSNVGMSSYASQTMSVYIFAKAAEGE